MLKFDQRVRSSRVAGGDRGRPMRRRPADVLRRIGARVLRLGGRRLTPRSIHSGVWILTKLDRARSRLYRSQILQVNMRLKALAEIYTMHSFAQLCNLNCVCELFAPKNAEVSKISKFFGKILTKN